MSVIPKTDILLSVTRDNLPVTAAYANVRRVESVSRDLEVATSLNISYRALKNQKHL